MINRNLAQSLEYVAYICRILSPTGSRNHLETHCRNGTEVSFCCVSVARGTYFSGVTPLDSNALCDGMLHFNGEAAHWPRNRFLWLAVSADVQQLQPLACKYVLKSTDTPLRCTYHVSTDSEIVTTGTTTEVRIQFTSRCSKRAVLRKRSTQVEQGKEIHCLNENQSSKL
jgi:hypothetical protein